MKTELKVTGLCLAGSLLVGMTLTWALQALNRERLLQQQVDELVAHANQLAAENRRLSMVIAAQPTNAGAPLPPEPSREMLRLRGEVGRLRLQERDAEQSLRDQMQAAQAKLTNAEVQLARVTKLHSENLVSGVELSQARFTVELLKAEAKGDQAEAAQIRLRQAEEELARA